MVREKYKEKGWLEKEKKFKGKTNNPKDKRVKRNKISYA
jgi:hypothetical protein